MSSVKQTETTALRIIEGKLDSEPMPLSVRENMEQHYDHLCRLADDLKKLGMDQHQIDQHVVDIFKEYERELEANIQRIKRADEVCQDRNTG